MVAEIQSLFGPVANAPADSVITYPSLLSSCDGKKL